MSRRYRARTFDVTSPRTTANPWVHNANRRSNRSLTLATRPLLHGDGNLPRKTKKAWRALTAPAIAYDLALRALATQQDESLRERAARLGSNPYLAEGTPLGDAYRDSLATYWDMKGQQAVEAERDHQAMSAAAQEDDHL